jgi:hypothetical protein
VKITIFPDLSGEHPREHDTDPVDLAERIANPRAYPTKAACPLLKLATFGEHRNVNGAGSLRNDENVLEVFGAEGDYDGEQVTLVEAAAKCEAAGVRALFYTSPRHRPEAPRWRVLAPFSKAQAPERRAALLARLNGLLGGILAGESFALSQTFYFGQVNGAPYEHAMVDGDYIDTRDDLDAIAIGKTDRKGDTPRGRRRTDA